MRKEIKTLEDLKGLFEKPIFDWKIREGQEVFVLCEEADEFYTYVVVDGDVCNGSATYFQEIPKPIEVTQENCQMWAKSSDAVDKVILSKGCMGIPITWDYSFFKEYQVCDIRPTRAETLATARPLVDEVAKWMKTFEEGE